MKRKLFFLCLFIFLLSFFSAGKVFAQGDYVLPYPGVMPGNRLYKVSQIVDYLQGWWNFGNLSQFTYQLSMADKKLVEAKTLFEYKQYLLASDALVWYKSHLKSAAFFLGNAKEEGKDVSQKKALFDRAVAKHKDVLEKIKNDTPSIFTWEPEWDASTTIEIHNMIDKAIEFGKIYSSGM